MTYNIDTQSLMALTETELLALYATLKAELANLPAGSSSTNDTSDLMGRISNIIHYKRRQRFNRNTPSI